MSATPATAANPMRPGRQFPIGKPVDESVPEPVRQQTSQGYVAPPVRHGQLVVYYPQGIATRNGQLAAVIQTGMRGVVTVRNIGSRQVQDSVPHVGDPRLRKSAESRSSGAWDLTDDDKARISEIETIRRELQVITRAVEGLAAIVEKLRNPPQTEPAPLTPATPESEKQQLLADCKKLGIEVSEKASVERLRKLIAEKVAADAAAATAADVAASVAQS